VPNSRPAVAVEQEKGVVKWFNDTKGFGYIGPDNGEYDRLLIYKNIQMEGYQTLSEGNPVKYEIDKAQTHQGYKIALKVTFVAN
jgi:cold shock protein